MIDLDKIERAARDGEANHVREVDNNDVLALVAVARAAKVAYDLNYTKANATYQERRVAAKALGDLGETLRPFREAKP